MEFNKKDNIDFNEENVKINIIIPFLKSLGFKEDNLSFEHHLKLRLGTNIVEIEVNNTNEYIRGYIDILVKRNNKNLFVFEIKRSNKAINKTDINQAISYARLIDDIAPFAIVSNGVDSQIFDVITKNRIDSCEFELKDSYEISIDKELRYQALKCFIGLSDHNLKIFCVNSLKSNMSTLRGDADDIDKVFIQELFIKRDYVSDKINNFLKSNFCVFSLVGSSGSGKSCILCHEALRYADMGYVSLFFRTASIYRDIFSTIAREINLQFGRDYSPESCIRLLRELISNRPIIIFLDGLDEWESEEKRPILEEFIRHANKFNIKLIISCKASVYDYFLYISGVPSLIYQEVFPVENTKSCKIPVMNAREYYTVINKYREFYGVSCVFHPTVAKECRRSPAFMRIVFEACAEHSVDYASITTIGIYELYHKRLIRKLNEYKDVEYVIINIAKIMYENNRDSIEYEQLLTKLKLGNANIIINKLIDVLVLEKVVRDDGNNVYRFYLQLYRDYLISMKIININSLNNIELKKLIYSLEEGGIQLDIINFIYPLLDDSIKKYIDKGVRENAERYLEKYVSVVENEFSVFKSRFAPYDWSDKIGFVGEMAPLFDYIYFYGFRAICEEDTKILFISTHRIHSEDVYPIAYTQGAKYMHACLSAKGFREINIDYEVINHEILNQLEKIVKKGLLNESQSTYLANELLIAVLYETIRNELNAINIKQFVACMPIEYSKIRKILMYKKAKRYYDRKIVNQKEKQGKGKISWSGAIRYFAYKYSEEDRNIIEIKARKYADIGIDDETMEYNDEEMIIIKKLEQLEIAGRVEVKKKDVHEHLYKDELVDVMNEENALKIINYVRDIYEIYIRELYNMMKTNYKTLYKEVGIGNEMPFRIFMSIHKYPSGECGILAHYTESSNENELKVDILEENIDITKLRKGYKILYHKKEYVWKRTENIQTKRLLKEYTSEYTNVKIGYRMCPIRARIYEQIEWTNKEIKDKIRVKYNV